MHWVRNWLTFLLLIIDVDVDGLLGEHGLVRLTDPFVGFGAAAPKLALDAFVLRLFSIADSSMDVPRGDRTTTFRGVTCAEKIIAQEVLLEQETSRQEAPSKAYPKRKPPLYLKPISTLGNLKGLEGLHLTYNATPPS